MRPLTEAAEKIKKRQLKLHSTIKCADEMLTSNKIDEAKLLYLEARHLSLYTGDGLQVRIMNEDADNELWHILNKKIKAMTLQLNLKPHLDERLYFEQVQFLHLFKTPIVVLC
jgi:hypothetical protein